MNFEDGTVQMPQVPSHTLLPQHRAQSLQRNSHDGKNRSKICLSTLRKGVCGATVHGRSLAYPARRHPNHDQKRLKYPFIIVGFELGLCNLDDGSAFCLKCNRSFSNPQRAKTHYKEVHATDPHDRQFVCHVCNKSFAVKRYLQNHMNSRHGLKQTMINANYIPD